MFHCGWVDDMCIWEVIGSVKWSRCRIFLMMFVEAFLPVWVVAAVLIFITRQHFSAVARMHVHRSVLSTTQ